MDKSAHTAEYAILRDELRSLRETAGLSQRALAARLKVPHSWVAKVEMGERRIDLVEFAWFVSACDSEPAEVASRLLKNMRSGEARRKGKRAT